MSGFFVNNSYKIVLHFLTVLCFVYSANVLAQSYAFITNQLDNKVAVIDLSSDELIKSITVKGKPVGVAVNHENNQI